MNTTNHIIMDIQYANVYVQNISKTLNGSQQIDKLVWEVYC